MGSKYSHSGDAATSCFRPLEHQSLENHRQESSVLTMSSEIDIEHLIAIVSRKPVIWDKELEEYHSRTMTTQAWREVCQELDPEFKEFSDKQKNEFGKLVLNKWKNIRDQWQKSCKKTSERKRSGAPAKHIRKYIYHDQMTFLNKSHALKETETSISTVNDEADNPDENLTENVSEAENSVEPQPKNKKIVTPSVITEQRKKEKVNIERSILTALKEDDDPQLCFFKSILVLPSIADFTTDEFLQLQSKVLNNIQNIKRNRTPMSTSIPHIGLRQDVSSIQTQIRNKRHHGPSPPSNSMWQNPGHSGWSHFNRREFQYMNESSISPANISSTPTPEESENSYYDLNFGCEQH